MSARSQNRRIRLFTKKSASDFLCGILSLLRMKWLVVNIAALFTASFLLISSNIQIVSDIFMREGSTKTIISPQLHQPHHYHPDKPHHKPLYKHEAGSVQWDFTRFWKQVNQPDPLSNITLYIVHNGTLYCRRQHQEPLAIQKKERIQQFEELLLATLAKVKHNIQSSNGQNVDRSLRSIGTESMPFFLETGEIGSCMGHPIFTFATFVKERPGDACIPLGIPSYYLWKLYKNMDSASWDTVFTEQHKKYPWDRKINKAVWRGSATGHLSDGQSWRDLPRVKLVQYSLDNPRILDAGISGLSQRSETEKSEMRSLTKDFMKMEDFQRFKAVVDIDGNSWSSTFMSLLCMNSVVLKIQPTMVDYSYFELQPWVHYLPVHGNMSNLEEMILLAISRDEQKQKQMQSIVKNANEWCRQKMTGLQMVMNMSWIMASHYEILKSENIKSGSLTNWRDNFFPPENLRNEDQWVEISSAKLSSDGTSKLYQPHPYHPRQPQHYPWYNHTAGPVQQWDFGLFWERVHKPNPMSDIPLYIVHNGKLYSWRKHQELLKANKRSYRERVQQFEDLILSSLSMVKHDIQYGQSQNIGQSLNAIGTASMPFFIERGDFSSCRSAAYPIFTFATFTNEKPSEACIPLGIPSYYLWKYYKSMSSSSWDALFKRGHQKYPWARKINKAIWRGSATGHFSAGQNWRDLPRAKLVQYSLSKPKVLDAGISGPSQRNKAEQRSMRTSGFMKKFVKSEDFQKFKAVVDIDGNSWSSRFVSLLCMNSVVLKVQPDYVDYLYFELQPWVHYLPVHGNLSNLEETILFATSKDKKKQKEVQQIVRNANAWCRSKVTGSQMVKDMIWIMASHFEMLQSEDLKSGSFTNWRDNFFLNASLWNEKNWVQIIKGHGSRGARDSIAQFHESYPHWKKPHYYPWYKHTSGPAQLWNFSQFWEEVSWPDPIKNTPLYVINNGRLFSWRQHQETLKARKSERVKQYEELITATLADVLYEITSSRSMNRHRESLILGTEAMPFFIDRADFGSCGNYSYPIFTFATFLKEMPGQACIPLGIPTYDLWSKYKHMDKLSWDTLFRERQKNYPWTSKISKAIWRGAATGHITCDQNWRDLPRAKLVQFSIDKPNLLDAGLKSFRQWNETVQSEMRANGYMKNFMNMEDFQKYKAIVDIDGNSWSSRFVSLLCMNSVVLKVQPDMVDYSYVELQPWFHYIPVHGNLSNLEEMVKLATSNQKRKRKKVQSIVRNANEWCQFKMTASQMLTDMRWIMKSHFEILELEDLQSGRFSEWREKYFLNDSLWNDDNWVEISSPHPFQFRQPPHYPWYRHTAGPVKKWNFTMLWEQVNQPEPKSDTNLYLIDNGSLYRWRHHQEHLMANNSERFKQFEGLITSTLAEVKQKIKISHGDNNIDRRLHIIGTESFPFFVNLHDFISCGVKSYPIFTFSTFVRENPGEKCIPLGIPSYDLWNNYKKFSSTSWDALFKERERKFPWASKENKAVWRGAVTGNNIHIYRDWRDMPWAKLVQYSLEKPNLLDSGIISYSQLNETRQLGIHDSGFMKKNLMMEDFQRFKAVVDIDGNSWGSRFVSLLCMNSVVLKVEPNYVDYSYFQLQPWVHYLPVHGNLSNLEEMILFATSKDNKKQKEVQSIVRKANAWCRSTVTGSQMVQDMSWIMASHYEILQTEDLKSGSFTNWRGNFFLNASLWNDENWVKIL